MARDVLNGIGVVVDFDGVIGDLASALIQWHGGPPPFHDEITHYHHPITDGIWDLLKRSGSELHRLIHPEPMAGEALRGLYNSGYTIKIATNIPPEAAEYRRRWLKLHNIPFDQFIVGKDKCRAGKHIIVEDKPENAICFTDHVGPAIVLDQPWNRSVELPYPVHRAKSWDEVVQLIRRLVNVDHIAGVR